MHVQEPVYAHCLSCGADWSGGRFDADCPECAGGALERACPQCAGLCGAQWQRAVADSNHYGEGHWIGRCRLPADVAPGPAAGAARRYAWWLDEAALPALVWAGLAEMADGSALVLDCDGRTHRFAEPGDALAWLREEEYDALCELKCAGEVSGDVYPDSETVKRLAAAR